MLCSTARLRNSRSFWVRDTSLHIYVKEILIFQQAMLSDFQVSEHIRCMDCNSVNNANTSSSKPDIHPFASQASSQECRKNFIHLHHKCQTTCWGVDWWMLGFDEVVMCFGFLTILITELTTWICSLMHLKLRQQMACWNDNSLLQYIWPKSWLPMVSVIKGIPLYFHVLVIRSICQYWWHVSLWLWYGLLLPSLIWLLYMFSSLPRAGSINVNRSYWLLDFIAHAHWKLSSQQWLCWQFTGQQISSDLPLCHLSPADVTHGS